MQEKPALRRRQWFVAAMVVAMAWVTAPAVALATAPDQGVEVPGTDPAPFIVIAPAVMSVIALVIPIVNGLLTKYTLHSGVKAVITIVLNAVAALLVTATEGDGTAVISNAMFMTFFYGTAVSVVSYLGLYKPLNLTSSRIDGKLAPDKGV